MKNVKKSTDRKNSNGFTLIEIIVSLAIISIALILLLELFNNSLKFSGASKARYNAVTIASAEIERLSSQDYDNIVSYTSTKTVENYTYTIDVSVTEPIEEVLKSIDVIVSWTEKEQEKNVKISKTIAKKE